MASRLRPSSVIGAGEPARPTERRRSIGRIPIAPGRILPRAGKRTRRARHPSGRSDRDSTSRCGPRRRSASRRASIPAGRSTRLAPPATFPARRAAPSSARHRRSTTRCRPTACSGGPRSASEAFAIRRQSGVGVEIMALRQDRPGPGPARSTATSVLVDACRRPHAPRARRSSGCGWYRSALQHTASSSRPLPAAGSRRPAPRRVPGDRGVGRRNC